MTDPKLIEAVARAIYDAPLEISGGEDTPEERELIAVQLAIEVWETRMRMA